MPSSPADNNPAFTSCDTRIFVIPTNRPKYACDTRAVFNSSLVNKVSIFNLYPPYKKFYGVDNQPRVFSANISRYRKRKI